MSLTLLDWRRRNVNRQQSWGRWHDVALLGPFVIQAAPIPAGAVLMATRGGRVGASPVQLVRVGPGVNETTGARREAFMAFTRRVAAGGQGDKGQQGPDTQFAERYPTLWDYMHRDTYDDNEKRARSSIRFEWEPAEGFKVLLKDPTNAAILYLSDRRFLGLLEALEAILQTPAPPWREDKFITGSNRRINRKSA